jgi:hypothetical protein
LSLTTAQPPRPSRRILVLIALLVTALETALGALPAHAVDTGTLGIRPAHESTFFHLSAYPGETLHNTAIVSNHTRKPVTLLDYAVDAHDSATGTFAMASQTDARATVGSWTRLHAPAITVPPESDKPLPFQLTVPAGTAPGDYAGALIIQAPPVIGTTAVHGGTAVRLNVVQRQGLRIYLHVDGTATRTMSAGPLSWTNTDSDTDFTLPIHNTGNTTLHPSAALNVVNRLGANTRIHFTSVESVLPGDRLTLHAHLTEHDAIQIGTATATLKSEAGTRTITTDYTLLPWTPIAATVAVLLLLLLAAAGWIRAHRRLRARTTRPHRIQRPASGRHRAQPAR